MLALCLASIPVALAVAILWDSLRPLSTSLLRHRTVSTFHLPRPLMIHVPFMVAVTILTLCLVLVLVSNSR